MRVIQVGLGHFGQSWAALAQTAPGVELVAVAEANPEPPAITTAVAATVAATVATTVATTVASTVAATVTVRRLNVG